MPLRSLAFHAPLEHFSLTLYIFPGLFCLPNLTVRSMSRLHVTQLGCLCSYTLMLRLCAVQEVQAPSCQGGSGAGCFAEARIPLLSAMTHLSRPWCRDPSIVARDEKHLISSCRV